MNIESIVEKQHYRLILKIRFQNAVLERVMRVIRHRGFEVLELSCNQRSDISTVSVTVSGQRAIERLTTQLEKLIDVIGVEQTHPIWMRIVGRLPRITWHRLNVWRYNKAPMDWS